VKREAILSLFGSEGVFVRAPVVRALDGDMLAAAVFSQIAYWVLKRGEESGYAEAWITHAELGRQIGVDSVDRIKRAVAKLRKAGWINTRRKGLPARNYYSVNVEKALSDIAEHAPDKMVQNHPDKSVQIRTFQMVQNRQTKRLQEETTEDINNTTAPDGAAVHASGEDSVTEEKSTHSNPVASTSGPSKKSRGAKKRRRGGERVPGVAEAVAHYIARYKEYYGVRPGFNGALAGVLKRRLKEILQQVPEKNAVHAIKAAIDEYFSDRDRWIQERGHPPEVFDRRFPAYWSRLRLTFAAPDYDPERPF